MEQNNQNMQQMENPDETAAVLAFATKLQEGLLPKAPQTQEIAPTNNERQESEAADAVKTEKEPENDINDKFEDFKKEVKDLIKEEISTIKKSIEEALKEDEEE